MYFVYFVYGGLLKAVRAVVSSTSHPLHSITKSQPTRLHSSHSLQPAFTKGPAFPQAVKIRLPVLAGRPTLCLT